RSQRRARGVPPGARARASPNGNLSGPAARPVHQPPKGQSVTSDRFDTAAIRTRVLDSWAAAPVRFREDANLEEDLVLGAYRDRVVIELAQNAADAATRAGRPGRLRLTLVASAAGGVTLLVANTGRPLDAARF